VGEKTVILNGILFTINLTRKKRKRKYKHCHTLKWTEFASVCPLGKKDSTGILLF
jgi:hypothetical protein